MKSNQLQQRWTGWLFQNNHQFLALSQVLSAQVIPVSEIMDTVPRRDMEVARVSDCKAVALEDLNRNIDKREAKK